MHFISSIVALSSTSRLFDAVIVTLGFEPGPLIRAVASHGLRDGAEVIVLTPTYHDERAERAYLEFEKVCRMMYERFNIVIKRVEVDLKPFYNAVKTMRGLFIKLSNKSVAICLTGGMRALCLAVMIAYLFVEWSKDPCIEVHLEGRTEAIPLPPLHNALGVILTKERRKVLEILARSKSATAADIAALAQKDRSTVYRHLIWLASRGLAKRVGRDFEITELGMLIAQ